MTPLLWASAVEKGEEAVAALLKAGAKADSVGANGHTPLKLAVVNGRARTEKLLRAYGAR